MIGKNEEEFEIFAENYANASEVFIVAQTRPNNGRLEKCYDHLCDKHTSGSKSWDGFETYDELRAMADFGVRNQQMVNNIQKYAHKAIVEEKDKYTTRTLNVAGGGVNVPLLLSGSPECMYSRKKAPVKSKIINMGLHCEITGEITPERYEHAGMLIAELVSKLEKAGYRLRINTMDAYYSGGGHRINVLTTVIKKENEPMNYARLLYPLTNVSFSRGMGFGWCCRNPDFKNSGLGTYAEYAFDAYDRKLKMDEMYEKCTGLKGFTSFQIKDMINMYREKGDEATMKYMEARLMSSIQ